MLIAALCAEGKICKLKRSSCKWLRYPRQLFIKVSTDLFVELPTSHYGNKNILVMVDHLTGWPIAKAIPEKEATIVTNTISEKLILEHGASEILLPYNGKEFIKDTLPLCIMGSILNILQALTQPGQMLKQKSSKSQLNYFSYRTLGCW